MSCSSSLFKLHFSVTKLNHMLCVKVTYKLDPTSIPGIFLGLGVLAHFWLKNKTRKIVNIQEGFEP